MKRLPLYGFVVLVYAFLFVPIVLIVVDSVNGDAGLVRWGGFTTRWFHQVLNDHVVVDGIMNSVIIASVTTVLAGVVGTLAAVGLQRAGRPIRIATDLTTYSRLIMPELVLAIGLLLTFRAVAVPLGIETVIVGHVAFYTAYVIIIVSARLSRRDPSVEEAARDLGASGPRVLLRVTLPEVLPAVIAAGLLVFAFSMDNVITSLFLSSGLNTLPLVLFTLIHTHITPEVNAIGVLMLGVSVAALVVAGCLYSTSRAVRRRSGRRRQCMERADAAR